ncbi:MAG: DUF3006 domain-containing protein [Syntrophomonadaceae bacterium]|jgi:hypothetical protein|nr:DUF3006 domain-containing protein [Syntrophomonadaceae bacterium]
MFIIDRIEGQWAVIEYKSKTFNLPLSILPSGAKEGDIIQIQISLNEEAAEVRKEAINNLAEELFED